MNPIHVHLLYRNLSQKKRGADIISSLYSGYQLVNNSTLRRISVGKVRVYIRSPTEHTSIRTVA